ncbi:hypothetical protein SFC57_10250 [Niallia circulans]|uniref:hypothetical protein n=2 Tax=Niallia circulans TaxID=1397 RepID=UPI00156062F9|nr:hypothetical protein [Niallia circulans]NRG34320.1 hypothetical protein [Niallia circulans]
MMKVAIVGDSIANGLGVAGKSYKDILQTRIVDRLGINVELFDYTASAKPIMETNRDNLEEIINVKPDFIIFGHGITEAMIRPNPKYLKLLPRRYRKPGWMDPRPFYSKKWRKRVLEKLESGFRWRLKRFIILKSGGESIVSKSDFVNEVNLFTSSILTQTQSNIIFVTQMGVDEKYYPYSQGKLEEYENEIINICKGDNRLAHIRGSEILSPWSDFFEDHFHPNIIGHQKLAASIYEKILKIKEGNAA